MKKIMTYLLICFLSIAVLSIRVNAKSIFEGQTLTIFNVEDYISTGEDDYADTIGDFEEKYGVKVNYYTYDTNETMYNQFKLNNGLYDLICTSDYMIQKLIKEDLVEKMDDYSEKIPNYERYASKALRVKLKEMIVNKPVYNLNKELTGTESVSLDEYAVGYMWGTLGILYDPEFTDTFREDVKSWDVFWDPKYKDVISLKNSIRDAFVVGLMHSYSKSENYQKIMNEYLDNPTLENQKKYNKLVQEIFDFKLDGSEASDKENKEKIQKVKEELISMKQNIFGLEVDSGKNDMVTGKIKMNLAYSGDAVYSMDTALEDLGKTLEYYVPLDGSNIWYDAWTLPKGANKELAYEFLNYLSDPATAADNMDYIGYTPYIVGDELFTLTGAWYGATDYLITSSYAKDDEVQVIYENKLYTCIKDKDSDEEILPTNTEYFECNEWSIEGEYSEGDMISYNGKIYNCISDDNNNDITDENSFVLVEPYDLSYLFEGSLSEGRRAIIYPYYGSENKLETQYPSENTIARCAIMNDFGDYNDEVVIMWGQVKAYVDMTPVYVILICFLVALVSLATVYFVKKKINDSYKN